jgi:hypothetical protein
MDPQQRHQDIKSKRLPDTGKWFLETSEFRRWEDDEKRSLGDNQVLGCYGIPGAGNQSCGKHTFLEFESSIYQLQY